MPRKRIIQAGIMVAGILLLIATTLRSQAPARSTQVWEYSSVSGRPFTINRSSSGITPSWESSAAICYATAQGCRREDLAKSVSSQWDGAEASMMAAAKLGAEGWELIASTEAIVGNNDERVLYFRRLKSEPK